MTGRYRLAEIRRHQESRRMLAACRGELRVRIDEVTHGHDGKSDLPLTACGIRWVPGADTFFPQGVPTENEVDCMSCMVRMGSK